MLNRSASLVMSTCVLKALPGKLDIKRHSPCILYISASLAMSTSVLKALPGKLDIKRHSPCILYISASLAMSTSVLKALPGKLDIKRHSPSILYMPHLIQNIIRESEKTQENIAFNRAKRSQFKAGYQNAAGNRQDSMTDTHKTHTPK